MAEGEARREGDRVRFKGLEVRVDWHRLSGILPGCESTFGQLGAFVLGKQAPRGVEGRNLSISADSPGDAVIVFF